jgi:alditol oxidase
MKPHQGKLFVLNGNYYEQTYKDDLVKMRKMMMEHDPKGKFRNEFVNTYIFGKDNLAKL